MMNETDVSVIARRLNLQEWQVRNSLYLFEQGATVPFVSRYRKEKTGTLDEIQLFEIEKLSVKLTELNARRQTILETIRSQEKLTPELEEQINKADTLTLLEDLYLPYKPKRKTRASIARSLGLEPLARMIMGQNIPDLEHRAEDFLNDQVKSAEEALAGARDIAAEWINENRQVRERIRRLFEREAIIRSKIIRGKEDKGRKYVNYFDSSENLNKCPSHRLLAMLRGEREKLLHLSIEPDEEKAVRLIEEMVIHRNSASAVQLQIAIPDAYKRLLKPSIENEYRAIYKEKADEAAISVFAENLRQLLLMPPLGQKSILAIDPGYRTGCKIVCLDPQGQLVHNETVYPHLPQREVGPAARKIKGLVDAYKIEAIAIGNGTAGRDTEQFIRNYIRFDRDVEVYVVSENGASVYSASDVARQEFPDYDVTVRGAVSIGRRLMDPLAELVKIDPKSIGVGQYQHDVDQKQLHESLDRVVISCVNKVGVEINTASPHLLAYVSGLGPALAGNIVAYIRQNGPLKSRKEILKVPRLGQKAFEQAAGFLRISQAENPLDNTAVHPERYALVERIASDMKCTVAELIADEGKRKMVELSRYTDDSVGLPTLQDIMTELAKPGRDPRGRIKFFEFSQDVQTIEDVKPGMILPGIVTNITRFGAFIDIGVKQDGLVHISEMADRFVKDPAEVVKLHEQLQVKVLEVDLSRNRIQLSLKRVNRS